MPQIDRDDLILDKDGVEDAGEYIIFRDNTHSKVMYKKSFVIVVTQISSLHPDKNAHCMVIAAGVQSAVSSSTAEKIMDILRRPKEFSIN